MSVFYLKYRPTLISDLDSTQAAERLRKILMAKDMPQSFLFVGPKGSGKTSAARILARAVNCSDLKNGEPCGKCEHCKSILEGKDMDIIEIDAASNRGIEDVRELKDRAYLMPSKLKKKVFIIDEVHMLTKDAFNALLKLIEEPPKHTMFVLCTTDVEKIPETVLSRLMRVDFRKGTKKELIKSLERVILGEGLKVENEVIDFVVGKSDGSFRNLHRIFNEIYLNIGDKINLEAVKNFYNNFGGEYTGDQFEEDLLKGKTKPILEKLEQLATKGIDFKDFNQRLLVYFQNKLLINFNVGDGDKSNFCLKDIERLIDLLIRAIKQNKEVEIEQLPLELAVIDFLGEENNTEDEPNEKLKIKAKDKIEKKEEKVLEPVVEEIQNVSVCNLKIDIDKVKEVWGNLLVAIKPINYSVEAFLRATQPKMVKGNCLVLEVFYPFHKDRLEEIKNRKIVEDGLKCVLGVGMSFECVLTKDKKKPLVINNDTPIENISQELANDSKENKKDLYDVAKDIFG